MTNEMPIDADPKSYSFNLGFDAYDTGIEDNPFQKDTIEHRWWIIGWNEAADQDTWYIDMDDEWEESQSSHISPSRMFQITVLNRFLDPGWLSHIIEWERDHLKTCRACREAFRLNILHGQET